MSLLLVTLLACSAVVTHGKAGYGPGEQDWGYVDVRPGAHMFYWLYYTTANVSSYTERPLAIWLQEGPGTSSTGFGNFKELGPLDLKGNERNWTWVKDMNVLFIDSPVGSGFSYVDNATLYTTTNKEIALDLVEMMKGFYKLHPEFETVPLHIFSQSYGGKAAAEFALELYYAKERGELRSNITSVELGSPWVSPIDSILAWGPLLRELGIVDQDGFDAIMYSAKTTAQLVKQDNWIQAAIQCLHTQEEVRKASEGVDFYNTMKKTNLPEDPEEEDAEVPLMKGPVSKILGIPEAVVYDLQSDAVFYNQRADFMKPVIHIVNELLEKTPLKVSVATGNLDLICATPGNVNWIAKLEWSGKREYLWAPRTTINVDGILEGYQKTGGNFTLFWINRSGHSIPADNPAAMSHVLRQITSVG
ncbi:retinoid-inducible serine carboxypeptidase-like isoform X1 [Drosophila kikkawai]|uniref:Retinoid-inducible serine carboxypeptidase n=1 Tax=Drosophila kikkawai TaxID=30033 RepID=A0A6P4I6F6_DROKI|nr:retinoid-inducible serine carboxypeptidase-like [Drosophila kikkawai]